MRQSSAGYCLYIDFQRFVMRLFRGSDRHRQTAAARPAAGRGAAQKGSAARSASPDGPGARPRRNAAPRQRPGAVLPAGPG